MRNEPTLPIGVMVRLGSDPVSRLDFIRDVGMECCQLCRIGENYMHGCDGKHQTAVLAESLYRNRLAVPSMFLFFENMQWSPEECGITPEHHRAERLLFAMRQIAWGQQFGVRQFVCHAGVFPEAGTPAYERWVKDMRQFCRLAAGFNADFLFETGPEPASVLKDFLDQLGEPNAGINFDPANLLIYDQTEPLEFLDILGDRVMAVHCKDAVRPGKPAADNAGSTADAAGKAARGKETPLGKGDTQFAECLRKLYEDNGFRGPLIIEREILPGPEQDADICSAVQLLKELRSSLIS